MELTSRVLTRQEWSKLIRSKKSEFEISQMIGYGFYPEDLKNLASIYMRARSEEPRRKILALLTNCNFHTECGDFCDGNLDKYIKGGK